MSAKAYLAVGLGLSLPGQVSEWIRGERERQGLSVSELARRSMRSPRTIRRIEHDAGSVQARTLLRVVVALDHWVIFQPRRRPTLPQLQQVNRIDGNEN